MKKNRYLPFGYQIYNGCIVVHHTEAAVVRFIFDRYIMGDSLQKLSENPTLIGCPYGENSNNWDKNKVRRVLENEKYCGVDERFPALLSADIFSKAKEHRQDCGYQSSERLQMIRKKMTCCHCGTPVYRNSKSKGIVYWDCKNCGTRFGSIKDEMLMEAITNALNVAITNPTAILKAETSNSLISLGAAKLSNEVNWELDRKQVDQDKILSLIFDCAAEKYKSSGFPSCHPATMQIEAVIARQAVLTKFNAEFCVQITEKIILLPDNTVALRLKNGTVITI